MGKQQTKPSLPHSANSLNTANELKTFFARFDVRDSSEYCASLCETIVPEADVVTSFSRLNTYKASGPDGLKGRTLNTKQQQQKQQQQQQLQQQKTAAHLGKNFTRFFQLFLDSHGMSRAWKTSTIIYVPKKATPLQMSDYIPSCCSNPHHSKMF